MTLEMTPTQDALIHITPSAIETIRNLRQQRDVPDHALRVFVSGGGCSGLQYGMAFEETAHPADAILDFEEVRIVIDPTSLPYLAGATIDFVDSLMGGGFRIENPNAVASCGCGHSFRTKEEAAAAGAEEACGTCSY
ncbi:MAG: iron-sulfur cluster assembly accessory protein [Anaerolineaceae bacterium]|nr:iron-sulfur cluster assembly accessory protein [Anaerolineaceae bacterium]